MADLNEKYIVVVFYSDSPNGLRFNTFLSCNYNVIMNFIKKQQFDAKLDLTIVSVEELSLQEEMDRYTENGMYHVSMDNTKALGDFADEVDNLLEKLQIKIDSKK